MRIPRSLQLWPEKASVHLYWRCHNREYYLEDSLIKDLFMKCLNDSLEYKDQKNFSQIHAFCLMSNHVHLAASYLEGSDNLSKFMRYAHSLFGARYNREKKRSGKVAEGRPKTPRIQNDYHQMRVHFYIEANPIRAKFRTLENLKSYVYSSYGFYAFGIKTKFTFLLTVPEWYLRLGRTAKERQRKYRKLFAAYIKDYSEAHSVNYKKVLIGDFSWLDESNVWLRQMVVVRFFPTSDGNADPPIDGTN